MNWRETVFIYKIFLQVWAQFNEAYAQGVAGRDAPRYVASMPIERPRYVATSKTVQKTLMNYV